MAAPRFCLACPPATAKIRPGGRGLRLAWSDGAAAGRVEGWLCPVHAELVINSLALEAARQARARAEAAPPAPPLRMPNPKLKSVGA